MSVLCALALTIPLQAATVVWSPSSPITDSADVVITGTTVLAAHATTPFSPASGRLPALSTAFTPKANS